MSDLVLACDSANLSIDVTGKASCLDGGTSAWISIPVEQVTSIWEPLTISESLQICGSIFLLWSVAYGVNFVVKHLLTTGPGRY